MSTEPEEKKESPLIIHLKGLKEDRAALAALRRGLGRKPGEISAMLPHVVPYAPKYREGEDAAFLVASLFGWHPCTDRGLPMGSVMRGVYLKRNRTDSIEQRFTALLNAHRDDLHYHLRQAVSLAKSADVAIDYDRLLRNINHWSHEERFVQLEWARQFWGEAPSQTNPDSEVKTTEQP